MTGTKKAILVFAVVVAAVMVSAAVRAHVGSAVNRRLDSAKYSFQAGCYDFAVAVCRRLSNEAQAFECLRMAEKGCPTRADQFRDFLSTARSRKAN